MHNYAILCITIITSITNLYIQLATYQFPVVEIGHEVQLSPALKLPRLLALHVAWHRHVRTLCQRPLLQIHKVRVF